LGVVVNLVYLGGKGSGFRVQGSGRVGGGDDEICEPEVGGDACAHRNRVVVDIQYDELDWVFGGWRRMVGGGRAISGKRRNQTVNPLSTTKKPSTLCRSHRSLLL